MNVSGYTVTKKKRTDFNHILVSIAFILLFASILSPFFIVLPLQEIFYKPEGYWFFGPPRSAFVIFIGAMVFLAVSLLIKVWLASRDTYNSKMKIAFYVAILVSFLTMYLALNDYRYLDGDSINVNPFFSISEEKYYWEDVASAKENVKKNKVTFDFTFKNGDTYTLLFNEHERKSWSLVIFELQEAGADLQRVQESQ
ncbi:hypothetical protein [Neobacillus sp. D3-1R]|uniref:hypothetical protein n=1 Tax=Neobacillus sp. D3-1R TaxID=3445778 RepID=UPI003F9F91BD